MGGLAAATFAAWGLWGGELSCSAAVAAMAFAGFLPFNVPKASIFLGDAGSHMAGYLAAAFALSLPADDLVLRVEQMILVCFVPLFELVFITTIRIFASTLLQVAFSAALAARHWAPFVLEVRDLWPAFLVELGLVRSRVVVVEGLGLLEAQAYATADQVVAASPAFSPYLARLRLTLTRHEVQAINC